jgi:hypothetical protein
MRITGIRSVLVTVFMLAMSVETFGQVNIQVSFAPPVLPVYEQPVCPGDGYIWTPGFWAWDADAGDYYWVPGTWVEAPEVGFLWTPGYWGWGDGFYLFHAGYWGPRVGFYGGINYGFGYFGRGFEGGRWDHDHFFYNRSVSNVNLTIIHNVYNERVNERAETRVSYNGGQGGINERPTKEEDAAEHERHIAPVADQVRHEQTARSNPELRASSNHGKPPVAATSKPGAFNERGAAPAKEAGAPYTPPANRGAQPTGNAARGNEINTPRTNTPAVHPKDLPPAERAATPNTGNPKAEQKYQQQQEKLATKQDQERQKLQQKQDQEHQRMAQQKANDARNQQVEQKHQQQTQQLQQKHAQQQQHLQTNQQPSPRQQSQPKK